jgi:plastocyanin
MELGGNARGWTRLLAIGTLVALLGAGCGGDNGDTASSGGDKSESSSGEDEGGTITLGGDTANDHGSEDVSGDSAEVRLDDFYFEPTVLKGEAGQKVTLEVANEGSAEHNFTLEDQDIDQDFEPGDQAEVEVTFPDSGTLVFFCKYHAGQGMRGALEVP